MVVDSVDGKVDLLAGVMVEMMGHYLVGDLVVSSVGQLAAMLVAH